MPSIFVQSTCGAVQRTRENCGAVLSDVKFSDVKSVICIQNLRDITLQINCSKILILDTTLQCVQVYLLFRQQGYLRTQATAYTSTSCPAIFCISSPPSIFLILLRTPHPPMPYVEIRDDTIPGPIRIFAYFAEEGGIKSNIIHLAQKQIVHDRRKNKVYTSLWYFEILTIPGPAPDLYC